MKLTIGGTEYELDFGLDFIATLDKFYTAEADGMSFGLGVEHAVPYMKMKNPTVLVNLIKAGTSHLKSKPSNDDIKTFLTELAEKDELDNLYKEFEENMRIAPFLKGKLKAFESRAEEVTAELEKQ